MSDSDRWRELGQQLRVDSIRATTAAGSGHPTSSASAADLVAALFFDAMRFDPERPRDVWSDRFILSKGHAALALYAALFLRGWLSDADLDTYCADDSLLGVHPEHAGDV